MKFPPSLAALTIACATPDAPLADLGAASDTDAPTAAPCNVHILRLEPAHAAVAVDPRDPVVLTLDLPLPVGAPWSLGVDGAVGTTTWSNDRRTARWVPELPLAPGEEHIARASACTDTRSSRFTTAAAQVDPARLAGTRWTIGLDSLTWLAPASWDLLDGLFDVEMARLEILGPPEDLHLIAIAGAEECVPPVDLGPLDLAANPSFSTAPTRFELPVGDAAIIAEDIVLSGTFTRNGSGVSDLGASAMVDLEALSPLIGGPGACILSGMMGEPCRPCRDGRVACVPVVLSAELWQNGPAGDQEPGEDCYPHG